MEIELLRADITSLKVDAMVDPNDTTMPVVNGGNLLCRFVIRMSVPSVMDPEADAKLQRATMEVLQRAEDLAVGSVALPLLWTTAGDDGIERCARIMLRAAMEFREHAHSLRRVVFCAFGAGPHGVLARVLREMDA